MYGVWYFAASVWTTLATVYVIAVVLKRTGPLRDVLYPTHFYYIGFAAVRVHGVLRLHHFLPILHYLERQHAGRNILVSPARSGHLVVGRHT